MWKGILWDDIKTTRSSRTCRSCPVFINFTSLLGGPDVSDTLLDNFLVLPPPIPEKCQKMLHYLERLLIPIQEYKTTIHDAITVNKVSGITYIS